MSAQFQIFCGFFCFCFVFISFWVFECVCVLYFFFSLIWRITGNSICSWCEEGVNIDGVTKAKARMRCAVDVQLGSDTQFVWPKKAISLCCWLVQSCCFFRVGLMKHNCFDYAVCCVRLISFKQKRNKVDNFHVMFYISPVQITAKLE